MIWNAPANGDWATTNWGSASAYPTLSANAVVDTPYNVTVDASQAANGLTVSNGGQVAIASGGSLTVATDVNVASGGTITVADGGSLATSSLNLADGTLQTQGTFDTSTAVTLEGTDRFDTSGVATLSGSVNNGAVAGLLFKTGSGTLIVSGASHYTGGTTVNDGTLVFSGASPTPSTGILSVGPGGMLVLGAA